VPLLVARTGDRKRPDQRPRVVERGQNASVVEIAEGSLRVQDIRDRRILSSRNAAALAWNAGFFLVNAILSIKAACHLLDLARWAWVIVDQHNFPRVKNTYAGFSTKTVSARLLPIGAKLKVRATITLIERISWSIFSRNDRVVRPSPTKPRELSFVILARRGYFSQNRRGLREVHSYRYGM
jgi:hypothetical protein